MRLEAGAMVAHSVGMQLEAKIEGGLFKGLKRSVLGNESLFVSTFTAPESGGWVDVAAKLPGDLRVINIDAANSWLIESGNWLASEASVEINTNWAGFKSMFGGESGFMVHASGAGQAIVASYGAVDVMSLAQDQSVVVDTGHVLAFHENMRYELTRAVEGKFIQSAKTGEGLVFQFTGPGDVMLQTRNEKQLISWIQTNVGGRE